jgi:hypothetical protein
VLRPSECIPAEAVDRYVTALVDRAIERDVQGMKKVLCDAVPEYCPQNDEERDRGARGDSVIRLDEAIRVRVAN